MGKYFGKGFSAKDRSWVMAVDSPHDLDFLKYIGSWVRVKDDKGNDKVIEIERIMGNMAKPNKFEIISKGHHYLISMLDFYAQMNGEYISPVDIALFDETQFEVYKTKEPIRGNQHGKTKGNRR